MSYSIEPIILLREHNIHVYTCISLLPRYQRYPLSWNHPFMCSSVTLSRASYRKRYGFDLSLLSISAWKHTPFLLIYDFMNEKHFSMGLKSGEYGRRYINLTPLKNQLV